LPFGASASATANRTLFPERWIVPRSSVATPSSDAISRSFFLLFRYSSAEVRDATFSPAIFVSCVTISACTPRISGTTDVSPLRLSNGSTATERSLAPADADLPRATAHVTLATASASTIPTAAVHPTDRRELETASTGVPHE